MFREAFSRSARVVRNGLFLLAVAALLAILLTPEARKPASLYRVQHNPEISI